MVAGLGLGAVLMVSTLLHARPQTQHLPVVGHRGTARYSDVLVPGRYAYAVVSTGGLDVIDTSDPTRPTLAGAVSWAGTAGRVCVRGQTAYVSRGSRRRAGSITKRAGAPAGVAHQAFR